MAKALRLLFALFIVSSHVVLAQSTPRYLHKTKSRTPARTRLVFQLEHENGGVITGNERAQESLEDAYYNAFNLKIGWQTQRGGDIYHELFDYPIYGVGIYSSTFGLSHMGSPFALYGFVAIPIHARPDKRWNFNYRIALGLSARFNPYNEDSNPVNLIIGTRNNVFIDAGAQVNYRLSSKFQGGLGLAFHHFSNGALRLPNTGVNLLPLTAAITYIPSGGNFDFRKESVAPERKEFEWHTNYAFGFKQIDYDNPRRYFKSTFGTYLSRHFGYKWRLGLGFDVFYSGSGNHAEVAGEKKGHFGSLFSGGPSFYIDHVLTSRLYLNGGAGYYLHRNEFNAENKPYFLRVGARFYTYKNFYNGVSIKAHGGRADFIEWTTGYSFRLGSR